ncbi:hypothetical protein EV121DRAFT_210797 [Schizophyllum commune]
MGSFYDEMPDWLMAWLVKQHIFFVATSAREGHVNVSPKGMEDTFHIIDNKTVWYEDLSGSGVETISHLRENGRITIMFTAFDKPPRIARLFGTGTVYEYGTPEYEQYIPAEKRKPGSRSVILVDIHKVGSSCGYAVPFMEFKSHRNVLEQWAAHRERDENAGSGKGMREYWRTKNTQSIDGVPGLKFAHETEGELKSVGVPAYARVGGPMRAWRFSCRYACALGDFCCSLVGPVRGVCVTVLASMRARLLAVQGKTMEDSAMLMPDWLMEWLVRQHIFFVATAARDGHVNVSPKGLDDTFHIVDSKTVWYEDLCGSGVETISHLRENGRITVMFTAFDKPPRIVRLWGTGHVYEYGTPEYVKYIPDEKRKPGSRSVILVNIHKASSSCGYAVPFYDFISHRSTLENELALFERRENDGTGKGLRQYWREWNTLSLDGLPGLLSAYDTIGELKNVGVPDYAGGKKEDRNGSARSREGKVTKEGGKGGASLSQMPSQNYLLGAMTGALAVLACSRVVAGK